MINWLVKGNPSQQLCRFVCLDRASYCCPCTCTCTCCRIWLALISVKFTAHCFADGLKNAYRYSRCFYVTEFSVIWSIVIKWDFYILFRPDILSWSVCKYTSVCCHLFCRWWQKTKMKLTSHTVNKDINILWAITIHESIPLKAFPHFSKLHLSV